MYKIISGFFDILAMFSAQVVETLVASAVFGLVVLFVRYVLRAKFRQEHRKVLYFVLVLLGVVYVGYLGYIWRLFEFVVGVFATAGALGLLFALALVPYVNDVFASISIALDPYINIGSEVEIEGKRGKIIAMSLTRTIISGDECLIVVPNKRFRDTVVVVYSTKPREKVF